MLLLFLFFPIVWAHNLRTDVFPDGVPNVSGLNISSQCKADVGIWTNALLQVAAVASECIIGKKCTKDEEQVVLNNVWALRELNAFGQFNPLAVIGRDQTFDGSYMECQAISGVKYDTNYCYMFYSLYGDHCEALILAGIKVATCMPKSCSTNDLMIIFGAHKQYPGKLCSSYCVDKNVPKDAPFWGFTIFLGILVVFALAASLTDFILERYEKPADTIWLKMFLAFSFYSNAGQLLSVKEQKEGFIKSLDCIRLFSMSWVVFGHACLQFVATDVQTHMFQIAKPVINEVVINAVLSVDTFFLLSGVVLAYMFFKTRPSLRTIKSPVTWVLFYVHRYLRLTPPIMFFIGFYTVYAPYIQGPADAIWQGEIAREASVCTTNWWQNLLYINNFYDNPCYGITWYLAVDTQIYIAMPIFLVALYFSFRIGVLSIILSIIGSITATYVLVYQYDLPATVMGNDLSGNFNRLLYEKPWIRCTPYLIGIFIGYILAVYGKRKIRLHWAICIIVWAFAIAVALACIFGDHEYDKKSFSFVPNKPWGKFARATYYSFYRIGWALSVSWVIVAAHFGWAGPVGNFICHPMWQPFGRLSYCAYIVHWMTIYVYINMSDRPMHYYSMIQTYFYYAVPITFIAYAVALIWSCLFEVSTLKLEKMLVSALMGTQKSNEEAKVVAIEETKTPLEVANEDKKL